MESIENINEGNRGLEGWWQINTYTWSKKQKWRHETHDIAYKIEKKLKAAFVVDYNRIGSYPFVKDYELIVMHN